MSSRLLFTLFTAVFIFFAPVLSASASSTHDANVPPRLAIVLASFGSTVKEAQDVEAAFVQETKKRYPEARVVLANTARIVMAKNAKAGIHVPSLFRALADLADEGYTHVAVQSIQVLPGAEFDGIATVALAQEGLPKGLTKVSVGTSLLASNEDLEKAADALLATLPKDRKAQDPVIFVGHGTHHGPGGMVYPALQWHLSMRDAKIFISTIEGTPDQETTLKILGKAPDKNSRIWVAPLLALAGDHAVNDLYGDEDDSWKNILSKQGWQVKESFQPLLAMPGLQEIWFAHLDAALDALGPLAKGK